jgi:hypothetical protein
MTASNHQASRDGHAEVLSCGAPGAVHATAALTMFLPVSTRPRWPEERPELSRPQLAERTGVSQRTAAVRALRTALEPFGSPDAVVIGRDGKTYPATGLAQRQPLRLAGGGDFRSAKSHIRQILMAFKRDLSGEEWDALVRWLREEAWEMRH